MEEDDVVMRKLVAIGLAIAFLGIMPLAVWVHGDQGSLSRQGSGEAASGKEASPGEALGEGASIEECFSRGLHATGAGQRYWYEQPDGFMSVTGIPYDDPRLGCTSCHVKDCAACHGMSAAADAGSAAGQASSIEKARQPETCLVCHHRQAEERRINADRGITDVHLAAGMECMDCHSIEEVHGDCQDQVTMHAPGNSSPACSDCHEGEVLDSYPHSVHGGKLDCAACHVENTLVCLNCHIDSVIRDASAEGNYLTICDWTLLINHQEQVTTGTAMTLVSGGEKFLCYAPYYTHAIQPQGRDCGECHAGRGVRRVRSREPLPMAKFWDDKLIPFAGVVPLKPDMLTWPFLEKEDGLWMHSANPDTARIQLVGYCTPLDSEQLRKLSLPMRR